MNKKELKFNEKSQNKTSSKNRLTLTSHFSTLTSDHKAITLIALVITIIVMLILVGVTVTVAINGGLFNTAKDAARKTQLEADRESLLSAVIGAMNNNAEVNFDKLNKNLLDGFTINEDGYKSKSGNKFFVDRDGNIDTVTIVEKEKATTDDYGKYVKYGVDLNGDGILTNDWKVFYVDDEGNTFIIAADYVTGDKISEDRKQCTEVQQAISASHLTQTNNSTQKYCYRWVNSDVTGDSPTVTYHCNDNHGSLNSTKNQCSFPDIFMATKYYCSDHVGDGNGGNPNSRCASTLLCSENWSPLVDSCKDDYGALYAIGGPTLEMWVASWNEKYGEEVDDGGITLTTNGTDSSGYGYYVGKGTDPTTFYEFVDSCTNGYGNELYFPHKNGGGLDLDNDGTTDETCVRLLACVSFSIQR